MNFANQVPIGVQAMNPIRGRTPDPSICVHAEPIEQTVGTCGKHFSAGQSTVGMHLVTSNMLWAACGMGYAGVGDVKQAFIG